MLVDCDTVSNPAFAFTSPRLQQHTRWHPGANVYTAQRSAGHFLLCTSLNALQTIHSYLCWLRTLVQTVPGNISMTNILHSCFPETFPKFAFLYIENTLSAMWFCYVWQAGEISESQNNSLFTPKWRWICFILEAKYITISNLILIQTLPHTSWSYIFTTCSLCIENRRRLSLRSGWTTE